MPINWGDPTTWEDVHRATGVPHTEPDPGLVWAWEPGFDWKRFLLSPDPLNLGGGATRPPPEESGFVWAWDPEFNWKQFWLSSDPFNFAPGAPAYPLDDLGRGVTRFGRDLVSNAADEATDAASATWERVAPWVAVGALVLVALEVRRAR